MSELRGNLKLDVAEAFGNETKAPIPFKDIPLVKNRTDLWRHKATGFMWKTDDILTSVWRSSKAVKDHCGIVDEDGELVIPSKAVLDDIALVRTMKNGSTHQSAVLITK